MAYLIETEVGLGVHEDKATQWEAVSVEKSARDLGPLGINRIFETRQNIFLGQVRKISENILKKIFQLRGFSCRKSLDGGTDQ